MKARRPSGIPVSVQSSGKPLRRSSSSGVNRRSRPSPASITCLKREGVTPPSPVRIVRDGLIDRIGNAIPPSEYRYSCPFFAMRGMSFGPFRYAHRSQLLLGDEEGFRNLVGRSSTSPRTSRVPCTSLATGRVQTALRHITPASRNGVGCCRPRTSRELREIALQLDVRRVDVRSDSAARSANLARARHPDSHADRAPPVRLGSPRHGRRR